MVVDTVPVKQILLSCLVACKGQASSMHSALKPVTVCETKQKIQIACKLFQGSGTCYDHFKSKVKAKQASGLLDEILRAIYSGEVSSQ
eukprot:5463370-Amphidinium_carterae.1